MTLLALMIGCGDARRNGSDTADAADVRPAEAARATRDPATPADSSKVVLFVGTSLTAGYGLSPDQAYPILIQQKIDSAGLPYTVVNAGVSGETSAGALGRIDWLLQQPFDVLVLETGANDMLRGIDPASTENNIQSIIDRVRTARPDARIVLEGMLAMPNLGADYGRQFEAIFPRVAQRNGVTLIPFLLEGVAGDQKLNQADAVHPTAEGDRIVAETVWKVLEPVLREELKS
jgi:acyl-CoA thioesterase I